MVFEEVRFRTERGVKMNKKLIFKRVIICILIGALIGFAIGCFVGRLISVVFASPLKPVTHPPLIDVVTLIENPIKSITDLTPTEPVVEVSNDTTINKPRVVSLGVCKTTAYCSENYPHICNNGDSSRTATGTVPTPGRTVAVDPKVIPYGSEVIINGHSYIAEDCGGAIKGNKVDILFATHREALQYGSRYVEVSYIPKGDN